MKLLLLRQQTKCLDKIDGDEINVDIFPEKKNARSVGKCIEAMALCEIVKCIEAMALCEIVKEVVSSDDGQSTVMYANDGSKKTRADLTFTVQGIIINGKYRAKPTMSIASESKI